MVDLIIGVDDQFKAAVVMNMSPHDRREYAKRILNEACEAFTGLTVPGTGKKIQLKLNTVARVLGHQCIETVGEAGLDVFLDEKIGPDILDTLWADMRALRGYENLRRFTFRVECQPAFLCGRGQDEGACTILPNVSFLPVGPVTDLTDAYFFEMGYRDGRPEAMLEFGYTVSKFDSCVTEVICSPGDISSFETGFWQKHKPVTPAVRPKGLKGNEANNVNAFDVEKAISAGSSGLILASPIMGAVNKRQAAEIVLEQMGEALAV